MILISFWLLLCVLCKKSFWATSIILKIEGPVQILSETHYGFSLVPKVTPWLFWELVPPAVQGFSRWPSDGAQSGQLPPNTNADIFGTNHLMAFAL